MCFPCQCCLSSLDPFGSCELLGHVQAEYFRCSTCGFVSTEKPSWLSEAYSDPIARLDVGLLDRCLNLADRTEQVLRMLPVGGRYLDWAGGYGVLTRLLRDRGFNFHHSDPYTPNIFASGWEAGLEEAWDLITMYEVLEHLPDPFPDLLRLAESSSIILFSTVLLPDPPPAPGSWWYYAPETGQHVSFYSLASLAALADRLDMELVTDGHALHAFSRRGALPASASMLLRHPRAAAMVAPLLRRIRPTESFTAHDFRAVQGLIQGADPPV